MKEHHKPSPCPGCKRSLDFSFGPGVAPVRPGEMCLCFYCGHLGVYADDLSVRDPTDEEIVEVAGNRLLIEAQRVRALMFEAFSHSEAEPTNGKAARGGAAEKGRSADR